MFRSLNFRSISDTLPKSFYSYSKPPYEQRSSSSRNKILRMRKQAKKKCRARNKPKQQTRYYRQPLVPRSQGSGEGMVEAKGIRKFPPRSAWNESKSSL